MSGFDTEIVRVDCLSAGEFWLRSRVLAACDEIDRLRAALTEAGIREDERWRRMGMAPDAPDERGDTAANETLSRVASRMASPGVALQT